MTLHEFYGQTRINYQVQPLVGVALSMYAAALMSNAQFYRDDAKRRAAQAVKLVEAQTSAELVIAVRPRSAKYGVVAYNFGLGSLLAVTLLLLVSPRVFSVGAIAIDGIVAFGLGALVCMNVDTLAFALTRPKSLQAFVDIAARAAFFDLGISRTSGRNGILVFVSMFERTLTVLTDVGINTAGLGASWTDVLGAMQMAVKRRDFDAFVASVENLGSVLAAAMPRSADDVNELPDEVQ